MEIFLAPTNLQMPNMVPFARLVRELCRNLCFICMEPLPSKRGRDVKLLWTYLLPIKTFTYQIWLYFLDWFLSCAKFVSHLYGTPPFQKREGSQTIRGTFIGTKNSFIQILTSIGSVVFEPIWIRQTDRTAFLYVQITTSIFQNLKSEYTFIGLKRSCKSIFTNKSLNEKGWV